MSSPLERFYANNVGRRRPSRFDNEDNDISQYYNPNIGEGSVWDSTSSTPSYADFMKSGGQTPSNPLQAPINKINTYSRKLNDLGVEPDKPEHMKDKYGTLEFLGDVMNVPSTVANMPMRFSGDMSKQINNMKKLEDNIYSSREFQSYAKEKNKEAKTETGFGGKVLNALASFYGLGGLSEAGNVGRRSIDNTKLFEDFVKDNPNSKLVKEFNEVAKNTAEVGNPLTNTLKTGVSSLTGAFVKPFANKETRDWYRENDYGSVNLIQDAREGELGGYSDIPVKVMDEAMKVTIGNIASGLAGGFGKTDEEKKAIKEAVGKFGTDFVGGAMLEGNIDFDNTGKAMSYMKNVRNGTIDDIAKNVKADSSVEAIKKAKSAEIDDLVNKDMADSLKPFMQEEIAKKNKRLQGEQFDVVFEEELAQRGVESLSKTDLPKEELDKIIEEAKNVAKERISKDVLNDDMGMLQDKADYLFRKTKDQLGDYDFEGLKYLGKTVISKDKLSELAKKDSTYRMTQAGLLLANPFSGVYSMGKGSTIRAIERLAENDYAENLTGQAKKTLDKGLEEVYDKFGGGKNSIFKKSGIRDKSKALDANAMSDEITELGFKNQNKLTDRLTKYETIKKDIEKKYGKVDDMDNIVDIVEKPIKDVLVSKATGELDYTNGYKVFMSKKHREFISDMWKKAKSEMDVNSLRPKSSQKQAIEKKLEATTKQLEEYMNLQNSDELDFGKQVSKIFEEKKIQNKVGKDVKLNNLQYVAKAKTDTLKGYVYKAYGKELGDTSEDVLKAQYKGDELKTKLKELNNAKWREAEEIALSYKRASENVTGTIEKVFNVKEGSYSFYNKDINIQDDVIDKFKNVENVRKETRPINNETGKREKKVTYSKEDIERNKGIYDGAFASSKEDSHNSLISGDDVNSKAYKKKLKEANRLQNLLNTVKRIGGANSEIRISKLEKELQEVNDKINIQIEAHTMGNYEPKTKAQNESFQRSYNAIDYKLEKLEAEYKRIGKSDLEDKAYRREVLKKHIDDLKKEKEDVELKDIGLSQRNRTDEVWNNNYKRVQNAINIVGNVDETGSLAIELRANVKMLKENMPYKEKQKLRSTIINQVKEVEALSRKKLGVDIADEKKVKELDIKEDTSKFEKEEEIRFKSKQNKTMYEDDTDILKSHKDKINEIKSKIKEDKSNKDEINKLINEEIDKFINSPSTPKEVIDKLANDELYKATVFKNKNQQTLDRVESFIGGENAKSKEANRQIVDTLREKYDFITEDGKIKAKEVFKDTDGNKYDEKDLVRASDTDYYTKGSIELSKFKSAKSGEVKLGYKDENGKIHLIKDTDITYTARGKTYLRTGKKVTRETSFPKDKIIEDLNNDMLAISNSNTNFKKINEGSLFDKLRTLYGGDNKTRKIFGNLDSLRLMKDNLANKLDDTTKLDVNMQRNYYKRFEHVINKDIGNIRRGIADLRDKGLISNKAFVYITNDINNYMNKFKSMGSSDEALESLFGTVGDINKRGEAFELNKAKWLKMLDKRSQLENVFKDKGTIKNPNKNMLYVINGFGVKTGIDTSLTLKQIDKALKSIPEEVNFKNKNLVKDIGVDGMRAGNEIYVDPTKPKLPAIFAHEGGHLFNTYKNNVKANKAVDYVLSSIDKFDEAKLESFTKFLNRHSISGASSDVALNLTSYIDNLRLNGANKGTITRELFSEITSLALGNSKVRKRIDKDFPELRGMLDEVLVNTQFSDVKSIIPTKQIKGSDELLKKLELYQAQLKDMKDVMSYTEVVEDQTRVRKLLAEESYSEIEDMFEKFYPDYERHPLGNTLVGGVEEVFEKMDRTKDLEGGYKELYDHVSSTMKEIGLEEGQIKAITIAMQDAYGYISHILSEEASKDKDAIALFNAISNKEINKALFEDVKNKYGNPRKWKGTIAEINEEFRNIPEFKAKGLTTLFETSLEKIFYKKVMDSSKTFYDKQLQKNIIDTMSTKIVKYDDFWSMAKELEPDEYGIRRFDYSEIVDFMQKQGMNANGVYKGIEKVETYKSIGVNNVDVQKQKGDGIQDTQIIGALWNEYVENMQKKIASGQYELRKLNERKEIKEVRGVGLEDYENTVNKKREGLNEQIDGLNISSDIKDAVTKLVNDVEMESPYISIDGSKIRDFEKEVMLNDGMIIIDKTVGKRFDELSKTQAKKEKKTFLKMMDKVNEVFKASALFTPNFHVGNTIGNTLRSYTEIGSAILDPRKYKRAWKVMQHKDPSAVLKNGMTYKEAFETFSTLGGEKTGLYGELHNAFEDKFKLMNGGKEKNKLNKINPFSKEFAPYKASNFIGEKNETMAKMLNYLEHLENGKTPREAMDLANKALFDYTDLTDFEMNTMKRIAPFYTFMAKNTKAQAEALANNPKEARLFSIMRDISNANTTEEDRALIPEYMQNDINLGNGISLKDRSPFKSFMDMANIDSYVGSANPIFKSAFEYITNNKLYNNTPVSKFNDPKEKLKYVAESNAPILKQIGDFKNLAFGTDYEKESAKRSIDSKWLMNQTQTYDKEQAKKRTMDAYAEALNKQYFELITKNPELLELEKQRQAERSKPKRRETRSEALRRYKRMMGE